MKKNIKEMNVEKMSICEIKVVFAEFDDLSLEDFLVSDERFDLVFLACQLDDAQRKELKQWIFDIHRDEWTDTEEKQLSIGEITDSVGLSRKSFYSCINGSLGLQKQTIVKLGVAFYLSPIQLWILFLLNNILFESEEDKMILIALEEGVYYELSEVDEYLKKTIGKPFYQLSSPKTHKKIS